MTRILTCIVNQRLTSIAVLLSLILLIFSNASFAANTGVIIPFYVYPNASWTQLENLHEIYASVPMVVVINPSNGPGSSQNPSYVSGIKNLQAAGITVIGYVPTHYATVSNSIVKSEIKNYTDWYGVNGIFFDEMSDVPGNQVYYSSLSEYAHSLGMQLTVGNAGAAVPASYIGTVNNIIISENPYLPALSVLDQYSSYPKSDFSYLSYNLPSLNTSFENSSSSYVGYLYITNHKGSNPYNSLPSYLTKEVADLAPNPIAETASCSTGMANTCNMTLKNLKTGQVVLVVTACSSGSGCPLSTATKDTSGLTYHTRSLSNSGNSPALKEDYAIVSSNLASDKITCSTSNRNSRISCIAIALTGINDTSPYDSNANSHCTAQATGKIAYCSITTTDPNDIIIGLSAINGPAASSNSFGFLTIASNGGDANGAAFSEYRAVASSGTINATAQVSASSNWAMIGDALKLAPT